MQAIADREQQVGRENGRKGDCVWRERRAWCGHRGPFQVSGLLGAHVNYVTQAVSEISKACSEPELGTYPLQNLSSNALSKPSKLGLIFQVLGSPKNPITIPGV